MQCSRASRVYARRASHRGEQIVGDNELVVLDKPTLERNPLRVEIVALVGRLGPREE